MEWVENPGAPAWTVGDRYTELIVRGGSLIAACVNGQEPGEIGRLLACFQDYVVTHFGAEEKYMARYAYPGYEAHKAEHMLFIIAISGLREKFVNKEDGFPGVFKTIRMVAEWIAYHARTADEEMGVFITERKRFPGGTH